MSRAVVDAWFGAFRTRDVSKLEHLLADDFVHVSPFGEVRGKDVYLEMVRQNPTIFFSRVIEIVDVVESHDRCAVRYRVGGMSACEVLYVRGGRLSEVQAYYHVGPKPVLPALSQWYSA